ncbi:MAG: hypothetical protein LAN64_17625 [Acidobacteriia bacterium]|nr:hypothetical protein [Terriglobia bacterium]
MRQLQLVLSLLVIATLSLASEHAGDDKAPFRQFSALVLRDGDDAKISPNISQMLGLVPVPAAVDVKQASHREGQVIRTFNVRKEIPEDIVIWTWDQKVGSRLTFYLTSPKGTLREAVRSETQPGGEYRAVHIPISAAKVEFQKEKQYWLARAKQNLLH